MHKITSESDRKLSVYFVLTSLLFLNAVDAQEDAERFYANPVYLFNVASDVDTANTDFDEDKGLAGYLGYRLLPWLSAEMGFIDFSAIHARENTGSFVQETDYDLSGYTLGLRAETSFYGLFDVWSGIGVYSWESAFDYEIEMPAFPVIQRTEGGNRSSQDVYFRVGVTLQITGSVNATLESAYFKLDDLFYNIEGETTDFDHQYIGIGLEYSF